MSPRDRRIRSTSQQDLTGDDPNEARSRYSGFKPLTTTNSSRGRSMAAKSKSTHVERFTPAMKRSGLLAARGSPSTKAGSRKRGTVDELRRIERRCTEITRELLNLNDAVHTHRPLAPGRAITALSFEDTTECPACNESQRLVAERQHLGRLQRQATMEVAKSAMATDVGLAKARARSRNAPRMIAVADYKRAAKSAQSQKDLGRKLGVSQPTLRGFQLKNDLPPVRTSKRAPKKLKH